MNVKRKGVRDSLKTKENSWSEWEVVKREERIKEQGMERKTEESIKEQGMKRKNKRARNWEKS